MRFSFLLLIFTASLLHSQVSNVRQAVDNSRIIITYDLLGSSEDVYNMRVIAINDNGDTTTPRAVVGDISKVSPGNGRSIWWEPQLEGYAPTRWKTTLVTEIDIGITWVLVKGWTGGDFYISATEVTFEQYDKFCEEAGYQKPRADFGRGKQPVIYVAVADAVAFCKWASKKTGTIIRLPEKNEWEYAAKGGNKSKGYEYSGSNTIDDVAWYYANSGDRTHEVGTKQPNELGIYDMSGNVWEWCDTSSVIRGGSWGNDVNRCRVSNLVDSYAGSCTSSFGFRVLQKK
jgi:hypothetical protein